MRSEQAVFVALRQFRNNKILVQSDVTQQKCLSYKRSRILSKQLPVQKK